MNILLTGGSSFTGYWFARELSAAGHRVIAPLYGGKDAYTGLRAERIYLLEQYAQIVWETPFGGDAFIAMAADGRFDLLCHHHARVIDYRSPDFDVAAALAENTKRLPDVLRVLVKSGVKGVVLTGTVFEPHEGAGRDTDRAFSPYGVSKAATFDLVRYWCGALGIPLGKFVIPNPFGPYEEPRFCAYLIATWKKAETAVVRTPDYIRDNIHADLLAKAYARFALTTAGGPAFARCNPSGYAESMGAFAKRYATEMGPRLNLKAELQLAKQTDFSEPMERINTEAVDGSNSGWSETKAWDSIADYYR